MGKQKKARQLALLGIILQSLHVLFGVTAVLGMLIAHTQLHNTRQTAYHSHLVWQLVTFWVAAAGYLVAFWFWYSKDQSWLVLVVAAFVLYRLMINIHYWIKQRPLNRMI